MISLRTEKIFHIFNFSISNTLFTSWIVVIMSFFIFFLLKKKLNEIPSKLQIIFEILLEETSYFMKSILENKLNPKILSFVLTFFIFILFSNWLGIFPGVGSILIKDNSHYLPLLRSPYSDLNMTLALGLISVIVTNFLGIINFGNKFIKRYLNPIGLLELIGEIAKILSFSFRLFGNVFAGEVLLIIVSTLFAFLLPIPFLGLEIFVGLIQALIFTILTIIFLKVALSDH